MTFKEIDCTYAEQHNLAGLYLAGKLSEIETKAFEQHYFTCERCWGQLQQGGEIRAALGRQPLEWPSKTPAGAARSDVWGLAAAAAAVFMVALGFRQLARLPSPLATDVLRGPNTGTLELTIETTYGGNVILEWHSHPGARLYRLSVIRSDGVPVLKTETPGTRLILSLGALPPRPAAISLLARIDALNAMNQVVAGSKLQPLPAQ